MQNGLHTGYKVTIEFKSETQILHNLFISYYNKSILVHANFALIHIVLEAKIEILQVKYLNGNNHRNTTSSNNKHQLKIDIATRQNGTM